ncbi:MAG: aldo/keto reductase [Christensenella sp.]|nr:aldo/keto reductase [Christensenella sp.]
MMQVAKEYELSNGVTIPSIGFGTWQVPDGDVATNAVLCALECGYTHIDTAAAYGNETGVGEAIRRSGIAREDLFLTTKLWNVQQGYQSTLDSFGESLRRLGTDYVDLYLIHWPKTYTYRDEYPQRMQETWRAFEELYRAGKIRAIGVSNFLRPHIETLMERAEILPMVDQIEMHPGYPQQETLDYLKANGILAEAWSPLACGRIFKEDGLLGNLAGKYGKTVAQVALRWHLQRGDLPIPKSVTPERIRQNLAVFDFELSQEDMDRITNMPESGFSGFTPGEVDFFIGIE